MRQSFKNHTLHFGAEVRQTKKVRRYFDLARNVAFSSVYGKIRHGALLTKGGSVINTCYNKDKFCSFGTRFRAVTFVTPIKGIRTAQLKIESQGYIKGDISINDFGLLYKKYTDVSASNLDE